MVPREASCRFFCRRASRSEPSLSSWARSARLWGASGCSRDCRSRGCQSAPVGLMSPTSAIYLALHCYAIDHDWPRVKWLSLLPSRIFACTNRARASKSCHLRRSLTAGGDFEGERVLLGLLTKPPSQPFRGSGNVVGAGQTPGKDYIEASATAEAVQNSVPSRSIGVW